MGDLLIDHEFLQNVPADAPVYSVEDITDELHDHGLEDVVHRGLFKKSVICCDSFTFKLTDDYIYSITS